jgi:hypothetical protein
VDITRASVTRWLVILVTGIGLVAMHSLMGVPGAGPHTMADGRSVAVSGQYAASASAPHDLVPAGHPRPPGVDPVMGSSVMGSSMMNDPVMSDPVMGDDPMTGHGQQPGRGHHDGSMLGHLCLAVLAALGLVLLPLLSRVLRCPSAAPARPAGSGPASSHSRAPPPTPTRLAQLCVSRR